MTLAPPAPAPPSAEAPRETAALDRALAALVAAVVIAIAHASFSGTGALRNQYDDSYITYRYALQLARGNGLVFNPGERTDAASSTLYTLVLAAAHRLGLHDLERVGWVLGLASLGATAAVVVLATRALTGQRWVAVLLGATAGLHGFLAGWSVSGMETLPFTLGVTAFVWTAWLAPGRRMVPAIVLAALAWTRPEALLLGAAWLAQLGPELRREGLRAWRWPFAIVAGAVAAYVAFKLAYYGTIVPHSLAFKRVWAAYAANPRAVVEAWGKLAPALVLGAAASFAWLRPGRRAGAAVWLVASAASFALGPSSDDARYTVHVLPTLCILGGVTVAHLVASRRAIARAVALALVLLVAKGTLDSARKARGSVAGWVQDQRCRKLVGMTLRARVDARELVLSSDVGRIAYEAFQHRFLDATGLTSADVLAVYQQGGDLAPLLARRAPQVVADSVFAVDAATGAVTYNASRYLVDLPQFVSTHPNGVADVAAVLGAPPLLRCGNIALGRLGVASGATP